MFAGSVARLSGGFVEIFAGNPRSAVESGRECLDQWVGHGYHLQHHQAFLLETHAHLHLGNVERAWQRVEQDRREAPRRMLARSEKLHVDICVTEARAALALAAAEPRSQRIRNHARRAVNRLVKLEATWCRPFAEAAEAGLASLDGQHEATLRHLEHAAVDFDQYDFATHAAAARLAQASLLGREAGEA